MTRKQRTEAAHRRFEAKNLQAIDTGMRKINALIARALRINRTPNVDAIRKAQRMRSAKRANGWSY